jgi:hypothetical protein
VNEKIVTQSVIKAKDGTKNLSLALLITLIVGNKFNWLVRARIKSSVAPAKSENLSLLMYSNIFCKYVVSHVISVGCHSNKQQSKVSFFAQKLFSSSPRAHMHIKMQKQLFRPAFADIKAPFVFGRADV